MKTHAKVAMLTTLFSPARTSNWLILSISLLLPGLAPGLAQGQPASPPPTHSPTKTLDSATDQPLPQSTSKPEFPPPSTPLAQGIQALLKEGVHPRLRWGHFADYQAKLEDLYRPTGFSPLWTRDGKATNQARLAIANLASADDKGLNATDYDAAMLNGWMGRINAAAPNPHDLASFDVALSVSLMRYASNLYRGRINPRHVNFGLDIEPKHEDLPALLRKISGSQNPDALIAALEPKLKLYEYLKEALVRYRQLAKDAPSGYIDLPAKFKQGNRHPDVPKIRKLLSVLGDLAEGDPDDPSQVYDKTLEEAVRRFQSRHGLTPDGVIGKGTQAQMNFPLSDRIKQIQLGLERLRWLPDQIDGRYIMVNIPSFQLFGFHDGSGTATPDLVMNVIVGEAINGRNTPVFHSDMTYVNFRPYWNVPYSITVKEYLPVALRNPGYLSRQNLEIVSSFAPNATVFGASYENLQQLSTGTLKLRQKPGPRNALGLVKFAFPNTNNVYLHSTPSQNLFKRTRRDFSHGCIRVEYPVRLAEFVFRDQEEWTRERIEAAMQNAKPKIVTLKTPIPVYIFYSTVLADADGRAMFFNDIYGHDQILTEQLAKGFPYPS